MSMSMLFTVRRPSEVRVNPGVLRSCLVEIMHVLFDRLLSLFTAPVVGRLGSGVRVSANLGIFSNAKLFAGVCGVTGVGTSSVV